jgi:redox-sensing transcriptional repressor
MPTKRDKRDKVSNAVIRRLPRYYRRLDELHQAGVERVSSNVLAKSMNVTASQIRQDLSYFGGFGQQGYGYHVETLRDKVAEILGMDMGHTAIILGCGNLGRALLKNFPFENNGFRLVAAFDTRPDLIGTEINGVPILDVNQAEEYVKENEISIAVLTVPQQVAMTTARQLVQAGVKGLWNFTNLELNIDTPGVVVEDVHFADSLLALSYLISDPF